MVRKCMHAVFYLLTNSEVCYRPKGTGLSQGSVNSPLLRASKFALVATMVILRRADTIASGVCFDV